MTAGYSGTPLAKKLGIREGHSVWLAGPPPDLLESLEPLPDGVTVESTDRAVGPAPDGASGGSSDAAEAWGARGPPRDRFDVVLLFCPDAAALGRRFEDAVSRLTWNGGLWACWPKKSSPLHRDLAREAVREVGLATGLVDNKVCAIDRNWSGLRFVVRIEDRPDAVEEGGPTP